MIIPIAYNNGVFTVVCDKGHEGEVAEANITFTGEGATEHQTAKIICPAIDCGNVAIHPVGGGAAPSNVQEMFIRLYKSRGCPCGVLGNDKAIGLTKSHTKMHAEQQDFAGRWKLDSVVVS